MLGSIWPKSIWSKAIRGLPGFTLAAAVLAITGTALWLVAVTPVISASSSEGQRTTPNRLINSGSPYLLQHAYNPVDWYPWGEEAMKKAQAENKPIFLSVGYSTCYWCHVAERTIYSVPSIARLMNKWFINIKVDREERPDIDETYMLAREILTGGGGWPNNVFLTPDLKPFFAGSYFPPVDQPGMSGFPTVLKLLHEAWQKKPGELREVGNKIHAAIVRVSEYGGKPGKKTPVEPTAWLASAVKKTLARQDIMEGGFENGAHKFPESPVLHLLLTDYRLNGTKLALAAVRASLEAMAFGGIHDQLGGGMHRYSTEPSWSIPHFEKMLYDNAQLLRLYTDLYDISRDEIARVMVADIVGYLARQMTAPDGGFYTAEDAAIDGKEGLSYLWSKDEIVKVLGSSGAARFFKLYELIPLPDDEDGPGVVRIRKDLSAVESKEERVRLLTAIADARSLRLKLLAVRDRRKQVLRDDKIVVMLNGLAIVGLARAGKVFNKPEWIASAKRAANYLWQNAMDEKSGRLRRYMFKGKPWGEGFLEDYAHFGLGLLALGEATGEAIWPARAKILADAIVERFVKPGGLILIRVADNMSIVPAVDLQESDTPSGTSAAYDLFAKLGQDEKIYRDIAARLLVRASPKLKATPDAWVSFIAFAATHRGDKGGKAAIKQASQAAATLSTIGSAKHVKASASGSRSSEFDEVVVRLAIEPGYHINANPASLDFLNLAGKGENSC